MQLPSVGDGVGRVFRVRGEAGEGWTRAVWVGGRVVLDMVSRVRSKLRVLDLGDEVRQFDSSLIVCTSL
jgi:hypothetical protein